MEYLGCGCNSTIKRSGGSESAFNPALLPAFAVRRQIDPADQQHEARALQQGKRFSEEEPGQPDVHDERQIGAQTAALFH